MSLCGNGVAQVGANQRTLDDLSEAVRNIHVADLQLADGPAVGPGTCAQYSSFCFAFRGNRFQHIGTGWHVLGCKRPAGKWLIHMKSLPARIKLIVVTLATQELPNVFNRHIHGAF